MRILSNLAYTGTHETATMIRRRLDRFCSSGNHTFWADQLSLRDERRFALSGVSHAQITDVYLLGTATANGGRLATFDRRIPLRAVIGADQKEMEIIPA